MPGSTAPRTTARTAPASTIAGFQNFETLKVIAPGPRSAPSLPYLDTFCRSVVPVHRRPRRSTLRRCLSSVSAFGRPLLPRVHADQVLAKVIARAGLSEMPAHPSVDAAGQHWTIAALIARHLVQSDGVRRSEVLMWLLDRQVAANPDGRTLAWCLAAALLPPATTPRWSSAEAMADAAHAMSSAMRAVLLTLKPDQANALATDVVEILTPLAAWPERPGNDRHWSGHLTHWLEGADPVLAPLLEALQRSEKRCPLLHFAAQWSAHHWLVVDRHVASDYPNTPTFPRLQGKRRAPYAALQNARAEFLHRCHRCFASQSPEFSGEASRQTWREIAGLCMAAIAWNDVPAGSPPTAPLARSLQDVEAQLRNFHAHRATANSRSPREAFETSSAGNVSAIALLQMRINAVHMETETVTAPMRPRQRF